MKALIVDDEQPVRSAIRLLADWRSYDIEEVLEAGTVGQAITCLRCNDPQLVITDIRMPQHDGLELMQWLRHNRPKTQVIVISAYNEFEYAIQAMRLGALDYLLKPIQPAQLAAVLQKASDILRSRSTDKPADELHPDANERILLALCAENDAELSASSPVAEYLFVPAGLMILNLFAVSATSTPDITKKQVFSALRELLEKDGRGIALLGVNNQHLCYLLLRGSAEAQLQTAEQILSSMRELFGLSVIHTLRCNALWDYSEFSCVAGELITAAETLPLSAAPTGTASDLPLFPDSLFDAAAQGSQADMQRILQAYVPLFLSTAVTQNYLKLWWAEACDSCSQYLRSHPNLERAQPVFLPTQTMLPLLDKQLLLDQVIFLSFLQTQLQGLFSQSAVPMQDTVDVCAQIRKDIQIHFSEPISLATLAKKYYRNPSYLSRAFKARYNVSIVSFLTEVRVEQAKILLKTTDYRISKIAGIVGYPDEKYFCRVFKKTCGLSPNDYRNL